MNRDEREQALWHDAYMLAMSQDPDPAESSGWADAAVAEFRKRYPVEPAAPEPTAPELTWHDEPPFPKDGASYPCWVEGEEHPVLVAMYSRWEYRANDDDGCWLPLNGRRVCPIHKPQETGT